VWLKRRVGVNSTPPAGSRAVFISYARHGLWGESSFHSIWCNSGPEINKLQLLCCAILVTREIMQLNMFNCFRINLRSVARCSHQTHQICIKLSRDAYQLQTHSHSKLNASFSTGRARGQFSYSSEICIGNISITQISSWLHWIAVSSWWPRKGIHRYAKCWCSNVWTPCVN